MSDTLRTLHWLAGWAPQPRSPMLTGAALEDLFTDAIER